MRGNNLNTFVCIIFTCLSLNSGEEECEYSDDNGLCVKPCPEGTYKYNPGCESDTMSQRTCRQPDARSLSVLCDYSRCDCPEPKVWDEAAKKCVELRECSDQSKVVDEEANVEPDR